MFEPADSPRGARRWSLEPLEDRTPLHAGAMTTAFAESSVAADARGSISGWAFVDSTRDLQFDADESPLVSLPIELRDTDGETIASALTDATGRFAFDDLPAGVYSLYRASFPDAAAFLDGGQRAGNGGGDALADRAIVDVEVAPGAFLDDYVFTAIPRTESETALPKPIPHESPDLRAQKLAALVSGGVRSSTMNVAPPSSVILETVAPKAASSPDRTPTENVPAPEPVSASGSILSVEEAPRGIVVARFDLTYRAAARRRAGDSAPLAWRAFDPRRDAFSESGLRRFHGDFDGDGQLEDAAFLAGKWWIDRDRDARPSTADAVAVIGDPQGVAVVGDLDGDGRDELVVIPKPIVDAALAAPNQTAHAFVGDWTGRGRPSLGLATQGRWWLDLDGDFQVGGHDRFGQGLVAGLAPPIVADSDGDVADEPNWPPFESTPAPATWNADQRNDRSPAPANEIQAQAPLNDQVFATSDGEDTATPTVEALDAGAARMAEWIDQALRLFGG